MDFRMKLAGKSPAEIDRILAEEVIRRGPHGLWEDARDLRSPIETVRERVARAVEADKTGMLELPKSIISSTDELWTIDQVAEYLGYTSEVSARVGGSTMR